MTFLDKSVIDRFSSEFRAASFLHKETEYKRISSLGFAFLDRMELCMKYLNEHSELSCDETDRDETEIVLFFVYSCWVLDGAKQILPLFYLPPAEKYNDKVLKKKYNDIVSKDQKRYFRIKVDCNLFSSDSAASQFTVKIRPLYCPDMCNSRDKCPCLLRQDISDDDFFEYLRSLIFAHPLKTDRSSIFQGEKDVQVSPFVIPEMPFFPDFPDRCGVVVRIYSGSGRSFDRRIAFSFHALKGYIRSRYSLINKATERIRQISDEKKSQWKQHHVNRDLQPIDILKDIKLILDERCYEGSGLIYLIDTAIEYLSCKITVRENKDIIQKYHDEIISIIPKLCDAVDELDEEKYEVVGTLLDDVLYAFLHYWNNQLEYIFSDSSEKSGFRISHVENFAKGFAQKWVTFKSSEMNICEIRLLVSIACYYENEGNKGRE